jgi:hypothetical protein
LFRLVLDTSGLTGLALSGRFAWLAISGGLAWFVALDVLAWLVMIGRLTWFCGGFDRFVGSRRFARWGWPFRWYGVTRRFRSHGVTRWASISGFVHASRG